VTWPTRYVYNNSVGNVVLTFDLGFGLYFVVLIML